jgi:hypothetical protein
MNLEFEHPIPQKFLSQTFLADRSSSQHLSQKKLLNQFHLVIDLGFMEWYFCEQEVGMILKILIGLLLGGAAGFGLSYLTRGIGSS